MPGSIAPSHGPSEGEASAPTPVPWDIPGVSADHAEFQGHVEAAVNLYKLCVVQTFGGPVQYLEVKLADKSALMDFQDFLWHTWPLQAECEYCLELLLPAVAAADVGRSTPSRVHIAMLAYGRAASFKPPPAAYASTLLAEHVLHDGFLTASEPLQVKVLEVSSGPAPWQDSAHGMPVPPFSLGYVKGMLRGATAMALLHCLWESGNVDERLRNLPAFKASFEGVCPPSHTCHCAR